MGVRPNATLFARRGSGQCRRWCCRRRRGNAPEGPQEREAHLRLELRGRARGSLRGVTLKRARARPTARKAPPRDPRAKPTARLEAAVQGAGGGVSTSTLPPQGGRRRRGLARPPRHGVPAHVGTVPSATSKLMVKRWSAAVAGWGTCVIGVAGAGEKFNPPFQRAAPGAAFGGARSRDVPKNRQLVDGREESTSTKI